MSKRIPLLFTLFFYSNIVLTSSINSQASDQKNNTLISATDISIADKIYDLLQKRQALDEQLFQTYKQIRTKNTVTVGDTLLRALFTGIMVSPALSVNYLNKYIRQENYRGIIDKISMGTAGIIGGLSAFAFARQSGRAIYDFFMYEREQKTVEVKIEQLKTDLKKIAVSIETIKNQYPDVLEIPSLNDNQEQTYEDFMKFYESNLGIINQTKLNTFLLTHQDYSFLKLIDLCKHKKMNIIVSIIKSENYNSGLSSLFSFDTNNPGLAAASAIMLAPWFLLLGLFASNNKRNPEKELKEVSTLNTIIKQLTNLFSEQVNKQPTSP